jgi:serine/threonine protein kinase
MSKLLGTGSYGSVFMPPLFLCQTSGNLVESKNYIGKMAIQDKKINVKEIKDLQKKRKAMDPQAKYSVPFIGHCKKTTQNQKQWNKMLKANGLTKYDNIEFIYEYGGKSWNNVKFKPTKQCVQLLFLSFRDIVYGLKAMNELEIAHMDIKSANIVYDIDTNTSKLIDYDFLIDKKDMIKTFQDDQDWYDTVYFVWPPEVNYIFNKRNALETMKKHTIKQTFNGVFTNTKNIFITDYIATDIMEYRNYGSYRDKVFDFKKMDTYSLGLVFAELFAQIDPNIWDLTIEMIQADPVDRIDTDTLIIEYETLYQKFIKEFMEKK